MESNRDLCLLMKGLHDGLIDPRQVAEASTRWTLEKNSSVLKYMVDEGLLPAATFEQLESSSQIGVPPTIEANSTPNDNNPELKPTVAKVPTGDSTVDSTLNGTEALPNASPTVASARYSVLKLYRQGGLGQVWRARDNVLGREIALKTMRPDRSGSRLSQSRFVREAKITAQLEHPSIVPLHELIGSDSKDLSGCCYTMRFVEGQTLAEAVQEYHDLRKERKATALAFNQLLDAFRAVCATLAFAHSRGIIHRDLKGQNIVLGKFGEVFLLDWGLGKRIDEPDDAVADAELTAVGSEVEQSLQTEAGTIVGTPAYMAPEVAAKKPATQASDIYGLGAILYVILTGQPPARGATVAEQIANLKEYDSVSPEKFNPEVPAALRAICMKALSRNVAERYEKAEELALEVRRWQAEEPTRTHRDSRYVRFGRWARRHRTGVTAVAVLLATAFVALGISAREIWKEQQQTDRQRLLALENFNLARDLNTASFEMIETNQAAFTTSPQMLAVRREILAKATRAYRKFRESDPDDPHVLERGATVFLYHGHDLKWANKHAEAAALYDDAKSMCEHLLDLDHDNERGLSGLVLAIREMSDWHSELGQTTKAFELNRQAREIAEARHAKNPTTTNKRLLAFTLSAGSGIEHTRGNLAEAKLLADRAFRLFDELKSTQTPGMKLNPNDEVGFAEVLFQRAILESQANRHATAKIMFQECKGLAKKIIAEKSPLVSIIDAEFLYATMWLESVWCRLDIVLSEEFTERTQEQKVEYYEKNLAKIVGNYDKLLTRLPDNAAYRNRRAMTIHVRGLFYRKIRDYETAQSDFETALEEFESMSREFPHVPVYKADIARTSLELGRLAKAQSEMGPAKVFFEKAEKAIREAISETTEVAFLPKMLAEIRDEMKP